MKKIIAILVPIICLLLLFVIVLNTVILPKQRREAAIEQYGEDFVVKFENLKAGDSIVLGKYEQDYDKSNGNEDIEWIVLAREDSKVLLLSKYILDGDDFHSSYSAFWKECALRNWLNGEFLSEAFSAKEQSLISLCNNSNETRYDDVVDSVFLLSCQEAEQYFPNEKDRQAFLTEHAKHNASYNKELNTGTWWLRTYGENSNYAAYISVDGYIREKGAEITGGTLYREEEKVNGSLSLSGEWRGTFLGIRPAVWISIYN